MELLSIPPHSTSASSTKVLVLDGTTAKSRTAQQLRIDGGGAAEIHAPTHASNGSDPIEISQSQVFDTLQLEDGSFLLAENGNKLSIQGVDDIRDLITAVKTVSASDAILGRKSPGSGFFEELTISDALDFIGATARGDIIYRGADGWDRLPAGTSGQFLKTQGSGGDPQWATVTSTGTVTSVSASGSNGVTATVTNQTTTPAINIGLGAITPTSVNGVVLSGASMPSLAVTGSSSISGSNTGDQTITLTGDVTGTGTGSFSASIGDGKVTYQKIQNVTPLRILGRKSSPAGVVEECTLSEVLDFVTNAAWGDILYRGQTGWARLPAGTNGQYLKTQGPTANPVWASVSAGSSSQRQDFSFSRGNSSDSVYIPAYTTDEGNGAMPWPFQQNSVFTMFRAGFVPTNYRLTFMLWDQILSASIPYAVGLTLQYSTNGSTWDNVASFDIRGTAGFREFTGSMSLGSPAALYFRLLSYNAGYSDNSVTFNQVGMHLTVWN